MTNVAKRCLRLFALAAGLVCLVLAGCGSQTWRTDLMGAQRQAAQETRIVLVAFTRIWSPACWHMDSHTLSEPDIRRQLERLICVRVDADRQRKLADAYNVGDVPVFITLHPDGGLLTRCQGYQAPDSFLTFLRVAEKLK